MFFHVNFHLNVLGAFSKIYAYMKLWISLQTKNHVGKYPFKIIVRALE